MSSSLLLQQCLVRLTWIVFVMGGRWPYSCWFVGCFLHDLFNIASSILVYLLSSFFSSCLISFHVVHPYSSIDTTAAWKKKLLFILSVRPDFHITDRLSLAVHVFARRVSMSVSVDIVYLNENHKKDECTDFKQVNSISYCNRLNDKCRGKSNRFFFQVDRWTLTNLNLC